MGVALKISGGNPVYRVIERYFKDLASVREYLGEFGVTSKLYNGDPNLKIFDLRGFKVHCSHPLKDILESENELPDNDMSAGYRESQARFDKPTTSKSTSPGISPRSKKSSSNGKSINLKQLCQELNVDPSKARQKLRKAFGATGQRYEWEPGEELDKVRKVIAG